MGKSQSRLNNDLVKVVWHRIKVVGAGLAARAIKAGANVNVEDEIGDPVFVSAVKTENTDIIKELLKPKVDRKTKERFGYSPLLVAIRAENTYIVQELLKAGADVNVISKTHTDQSIVRPFHVAVAYPKIEIFKELVKYGAHINYDDKGEVSTLHLLAVETKRNILREMYDDKKTCNARGKYNRTFLHYAASLGSHQQITDVLSLSGVNVDLKDDFGNSPLHCAVQIGNLETIRALIIAGCDTEAVDSYGRTVLHLAAIYGHSDLIDLFIDEYGLDPLQLDENQRNCLHYAVIFRREDFVRTLVQRNADALKEYMLFNKKDSCGKTPSDYLQSCEKSSLISKYLHCESAGIQTVPLKDQTYVPDIFNAISITCNLSKISKKPSIGSVATITGHDNEMFVNYVKKIVEAVIQEAVSTSLGVDKDTDTGTDADIDSDTDTDTCTDIEDRDDSEDRKDSEDMEDMEDVEDSEDIEDMEDSEDMEDREDSEDMEDIEDIEDIEDMEDSEDMEDIEDGEDIEDREDIKDRGDRDRADRKEREVVGCGSSFEGTKTGMPDEFDFLVKLDSVTYEPAEHEGYGELYRDPLTGSYGLWLWRKLLAFWSERQTEGKALYSDGHRSMKMPLPPQRHPDRKTCTTWIWLYSDEMFTDLPVSIDFVPAVEISLRYPGTRIRSTWMMTEEKMRKEKKCYIVPKIPNEKSKVTEKLVTKNLHQIGRVSYPTLEVEHIQALEDRVKDVYIAAKCMRNVEVCGFEVKNDNGDTRPVSELVTSYRLKSVFLHLAELFIKSDMSLGKMVLMVYEQLEKCLERDHLPMFFEPDINVLAGSKLSTEESLQATRIITKFVRSQYERDISPEQRERDAAEEERVLEEERVAHADYDERRRKYEKDRDECMKYGDELSHIYMENEPLPPFLPIYLRQSKSNSEQDCAD